MPATMLMAATTPTTTPAAMPATLLEPELDLEVASAAASLEVVAWAGWVTMTVLPGDVFVTTFGVGDDLLVRVAVVEEDELSPPPPLPPNEATLVSWPVSHTVKYFVPPPPVVFPLAF